MKILTKKTIKQIESKFNKFQSDKIIMDSGKNDKDLTINSLISDLTYVYVKLGFIK